ncbi:hypothetical protein B296_00043184 [Ensete ventricosum]|uniref:Uncharacterized protein n=1 Tax=Ensete ventricosum TaxID=4639 RepID=A0A426ZFQ3_ENSVE|nr:hypothetical protein B296_00043184 [Ensete ventricosum]
MYCAYCPVQVLYRYRQYVGTPVQTAVYDVTDETCFRHTGISKNGLGRLPTFISEDYKIGLQQPAERKYKSVHKVTFG